MTHSITWENNGIYRQFKGLVSGEEILESNFALQADARFVDINYIINDFTDVTEHTITVTDTNAYAITDEIAANKKPNIKIAIVVTKKDLFDLADTYSALMKAMKFDVKIFKTTEQARLWVS